MNVEILRFKKSLKGPTLGILSIKGVFVCFTLELPWLENKEKVSCIPEGMYMCKQVKDRTTDGGTFIPRTYQVVGVLNRTGILFHIGNSLKNTSGCILVGKGVDDSEGIISSSVLGFQELLRRTEGEKSFDLNIRSL
jgi:hypothetical protein